MENKIAAVEQNVKTLHDRSANDCLREWFFEGHVQVVVENARRIAAREGVDPEVPVLAALLHDIARTIGEDDDPALGHESERLAREILERYGFDTKTIEHVCHIMAIHSCRGENRPDTPEAKVMVTADALAHLLTDFYFILPFNGWLTAAKDFEGYKRWVLEKIERDTFKKIQFEEDRALVLPKYQALKVLFGG